MHPSRRICCGLPCKPRNKFVQCSVPPPPSIPPLNHSYTPRPYTLHPASKEVPMTINIPCLPSHPPHKTHPAPQPQKQWPPPQALTLNTATPLVASAGDLLCSSPAPGPKNAYLPPRAGLLNTVLCRALLACAVHQQPHPLAKKNPQRMWTHPAKAESPSRASAFPANRAILSHPRDARSAPVIIPAPFLRFSWFRSRPCHFAADG